MVLILSILFLFDFINKKFCVLLWYRNCYREPWIFTGIGTDYRNVGTVTTLIYIYMKILYILLI